MVATAADALVPALLAGGLVALGWWAPPPLYEDPSLPLLERLAVTFAWGWPKLLQALVVLHLPWVAWHVAWGVANVETPGARVAGVRLVDRAGLPAGPGQRLARAALLLTWPLSLYAAPLVSFVSRSGRGPVDWLSGTAVVDA